MGLIDVLVEFILAVPPEALGGCICGAMAFIVIATLLFSGSSVRSSQLSREEERNQLL